MSYINLIHRIYYKKTKACNKLNPERKSNHKKSKSINYLILQPSFSQNLNLVQKVNLLLVRLCKTQKIQLYYFH